MDYASIIRQGEKEYTSDFVAVSEDGDCCCFTVADGHDTPEAAVIAAQSVIEDFENIGEITKPAIENFFSHADEKLKDVETPTTVCMATLLTNGNVAVWGHIGDCRVYLIRDNLLYEITPDHSDAYTLYEAGEIRYPKIRRQKTRYNLTRVLGSGDNNTPDFSQPEVVKKGDAFLVCTDGFWENIHELQIEKTLKKSKSAQDWLEKMTSIVEKNIKHKKYTRFKDSLGAVVVKM